MQLRLWVCSIVLYCALGDTCLEFDCKLIGLETSTSSGTCFPSGSPLCVTVCCKPSSILPDWELGVRIEQLKTDSTLTPDGSQCLPIAPEPRWRFKERAKDLEEPPAGMVNLTNTELVRMTGFLEWNKTTGITLSDFGPNNACPAGSFVKFGTPLPMESPVSSAFVRVPFIMEIPPGSTKCTIGTKNNMDAQPLYNHPFRLWRRPVATWHDASTIVNFGRWKDSLLHFICEDNLANASNCPGAKNFRVGSELCQFGFVQCLSIENPQDLDLSDPSLWWSLLTPGTMSPDMASDKSVDLVLNKFTHFAVLLQGDSYSRGPIDFTNLTIGLAPLDGMAILALDPRVTGAWTFPDRLQALFATGSSITSINKASGVAPNLVVYSGHIPTSGVMPLMPSLRVLQLSDRQFAYYDHFQQSSGRGQMANPACSKMFQAYHAQEINASSLVCRLRKGTEQACGDAAYCFHDDSFKNLEKLSILGLRADIYNCLLSTPPDPALRFPALKQLIIEGSPITSIDINNHTLDALRLSHNPYLRNVTNLRNGLTILALMGNPLLNPLNIRNMTLLKVVALSYSRTIDFNLLPLQLEQIVCSDCGLKVLPDLSPFNSLRVLDFSRNQLYYSISEFLNLPWFPPPNLRYLDLSANAIYGRFPEKPDYYRLMLPGRGDAVFFNLDFNQIESARIPTDKFKIDEYRIFPPTFLSDVVTSPESGRLLDAQGRPWLSLRFNKLKGNINSTLYLDRIALGSNNYWCPEEINHLNCVAHRNPIIASAFVYGVAKQSDLTSKMNVTWPYALPRREVQSISLRIRGYNAQLTSATLLGSRVDVLNDGAGSYSMNLLGATIGTLDCSPEQMTVEYTSFTDIRIISCWADILLDTPAPLSVTLVRQPVLLVDACSPGRGFNMRTNQCEGCEVNSFSEVWATGILPEQNIVDLNFSCAPCPVFSGGTSSVTSEASATSVSQCVCPQGTYGYPAVHNTSSKTNSIKCEPCNLKAMVCDTHNVSVPKAEPGYFFSSKDNVFLLCDPAVACFNGGCTRNYVGSESNPACGACAPNYYRINRECQPCSNFPEVLLVILAIGLLLGLLFLLKVSRHDFTKIFSISLSLGYIQIISIFASFPVNWPSTTHIMLNFLSFFNFNFDLASPECAVKSTFWDKWVMKLCLPVLACLVLFIWYMVVKRFSRIQSIYLRFVTNRSNVTCLDKIVGRVLVGKSARQLIHTKSLVMAENLGPEHDMYQANLTWEKEHLSHRFISAVVTLALLGFTFAAKTSTQPFNCLKTTINGVDTYHLRADASMECYGDLWYSYLPVAILGILLYCVAIPITFFVILIQAHRKKRIGDTNFLAMFGALVLPFREQFWYWELVQLARKLCTVMFIDFNADTTNTSTFAQINSVLVVLVLFLILQEFVRPYDFQWCNRLEFAWTAMSLVVLMAALVFSMNTLTDTQSNAYAVFLILALVATLATAVYSFLLEKRRSFVRVGLYKSRKDRIQEEHSLLGSAFGDAVGSNLFRKTRDMNPEIREEFLDRLSTLVGSTPHKLPLKTVPDQQEGNPAIFPTSMELTPVVPQRDSSETADNGYSTYSAATPPPTMIVLPVREGGQKNDVTKPGPGYNGIGYTAFPEPGTETSD